MIYSRFTQLLMVLASGWLLLGPAAAQNTTIVSVNGEGVIANAYSEYPSISADGSFVAFSSRASNLVSSDTNSAADIFVHDRRTGQTTRASVKTGGQEGNGWSYLAAISGDGQYVAFQSYSTNLVPGDTNYMADVFVHDRQTLQTSRVSVDSAGAQVTGDSGIFGLAISADGRRVAFESTATDLVTGDTNNRRDVFVHDRQTGITSRVSVDSAGVQANGASGFKCLAISADGLFVAYASGASNLVSNDTNGTDDVFVHEIQTGQTRRVSVTSTGVQGGGSSGVQALSISADGRFVVFDSSASNLVPNDANNRDDVFTHDRLTGQTSLVSVDAAGLPANGHSRAPSISGDGRFVSFESQASNLVLTDTNGRQDAFVHDRVSGVTALASVDFSGVQGNSESSWTSMSADGRCVAFDSLASNFVANDRGGQDLFVHHPRSNAPSLVRVGLCGSGVTLTISNLTAGGQFAMVYGPVGTFVKPTPPCAGLTLRISAPTLALLRQSSSAAVTLNFTAPPGICGFSLQAVDVSSCSTSNVIIF